MGRKLFKEHLEKAQSQLSNFAQEFCEIAKVHLEEDTLRIDLSPKNNNNNQNNNNSLSQTSITLYIPDSYPKGEWNLIDENSEMESFDNKELSALLELLAGRYSRRFQKKILGTSGSLPAPQKAQVEESLEEEEEDYSFEDSLEENDFVDSDVNPLKGALDQEPIFHIDEKEAAVMEDQLKKEIAQLKNYGFSGGYYKDMLTKDLLVRVALPLEFLGKYQSEAWSITPGVPAVLELLFSWKYLNDTKLPPKIIRISQSSDKDLSKRELSHSKDFSISWFLTNRLSDILRRNWVKFYRTSNGSVKQQEVQVNEEIKALIQAGYSERFAKSILKAYPDVTTAISKLKIEENRTQLETETESFKIAEAYSDPLYTGLPGYSAHEVGDLENFFLGNESFLVKLAKYSTMRLRNCTAACMICDSPLSYAGLKPSPCSKPLCNHSFDSYGLGFSLEAQLTHHSTVVDLLIAVTVAAAKNKRANGADVFEPFPDSVQVTHKDQILGFVKGNQKLMNELVEVCEAMPSVAEMKQYQSKPKELKSLLDKQNPLCYPLLRWILMSNLCQISPLRPEQHIKEMNTPWQFVLVSSTPEKEGLFRARKEALAKKYGKGSFYAFHGSALGNWHCIFRQGLKNYSGTEKMSSGQAYGSGIYLATHASVSFGYMVGGHTWSKCGISNGGTLACIALCEVLNLKKEKNSPLKDHGHILTCTDASAITTRFFFLYPNYVHHPNSNQISGAVAEKLKLPSNVF